jgi:hypothetical protein
VDSGFTPASSPNVASATLSTEVVGAVTGSGGEASINPYGSIAAGPSITSFDLQQFRLGCDVDVKNTVVTLGSSCVISIFGYYVNGQQVPVYTASFALTSLTGTPMALVDLPSSFTGLKNVTFGVAQGEVATSLTVLSVDNLVHCDYS